MYARIPTLELRAGDDWLEGHGPVASTRYLGADRIIVTFEDGHEVSVSDEDTVVVRRFAGVQTPTLERHPTPPLTQEEGLSYEDWFAKVDGILLDKVGIGANDGSDWPSWDTWNDGATPLDAIEAWADYQDIPEGLI